MTSAEQVNELGLILSMQANPGESALAAAFLLLQADGLIPQVWHYQKPPTLREFLDIAARKDSMYFVAYVQEIGSDVIQIAGMGWAIDAVKLGPDRGFRATVGQAFLRKFWRKTICQELAGQMVAHGFDHANIEIMYGFTPTKNPATVRFIRKMGFDVLCVAPDFGVWDNGTSATDISVSVARRDTWRGPIHGRRGIQSSTEPD